MPRFVELADVEAFTSIDVQSPAGGALVLSVKDCAHGACKTKATLHFPSKGPPTREWRGVKSDVVTIDTTATDRETATPIVPWTASDGTATTTSGRIDVNVAVRDAGGKTMRIDFSAPALKHACASIDAGKIAWNADTRQHPLCVLQRASHALDKKGICDQ